MLNLPTKYFIITAHVGKMGPPRKRSPPPVQERETGDPQMKWREGRRRMRTWKGVLGGKTTWVTVVRVKGLSPDLLFFQH